MVARSRRKAKRYAQKHHFYWVACPICGEEFGGHEYIGGGVQRAENVYRHICPDCCRAGRGQL